MLRILNITDRGLINWLFVFAFLIFSLQMNAQSDKKFIRKGNREYDKGKFSESEISYRKAIDKNKESADAVFNVGDALFKQNKFEDAGKQFTENANLNADKKKKSASFYNLGNSLLKANKVQESIEAYKGSLKLQPDNDETKFNLAYAQDLLKKQQEQEKNKQQQDKNDKNQNKDKSKEDQKKDQQNQKDKSNDQKMDQYQNQNQQKQQSISKEDAQRLLNALANDEKKVQEKVKLAKADKNRVRTVKNW
jgi:Ca-activated chloride channel homolog